MTSFFVVEKYKCHTCNTPFITIKKVEVTIAKKKKRKVEVTRHD